MQTTHAADVIVGQTAAPAQAAAMSDMWAARLLESLLGQDRVLLATVAKSEENLMDERSCVSCLEAV